jgi:hypothetical protein
MANDPSGHRFTDIMSKAESEIIKKTYASLQGVYALAGAEDWLSKAGVEVYNRTGWYDQNIVDAGNAVLTTGKALARAGAGASWDEAFRNTFGPIRMIWGDTYNGNHFGTHDPSITDPNEDKMAWATCYNVGAGCSPGYRDGKYNIMFNMHFATGLYFSTIITHELGHTFAYQYGLGTEVGSTYHLGLAWEYKADQILNGLSPSTYRHSSSVSPSEIFADMFTAWAYDVWNPLAENKGFVDQATAGMAGGMRIWLP